MRQKAQQAGNLSSTQQQTVTSQGPTIVIQPTAPDVVYVPAYDPWLVYGPGIVAWPGWYPYPGIWYGGAGFVFRGGLRLGLFLWVRCGLGGCWVRLAHHHPRFYY